MGGKNLVSNGSWWCHRVAGAQCASGERRLVGRQLSPVSPEGHGNHGAAHGMAEGIKDQCEAALG